VRSPIGEGDASPEWDDRGGGVQVKLAARAVEGLTVTEYEPKSWGSVCALTDVAMYALADVEQTIMAVDGRSLTPLEFRTLLWVRCSLASLYGVRADEMLSDVESLAGVLDGDWVGSLIAD
jgi:hypothetical protein